MKYIQVSIHVSLSLSQFVEIHKLHPKLPYILAFFNPKFDVCSGGDSQTAWLCFRYFEFVPGMVRPYSNPDLHRKLVLDYAKVCSKMKAWQFEHSNVRLDWLGINTRSVYIYIQYIYTPYTIPQLGYDLSHKTTGDRSWEVAWTWARCAKIRAGEVQGG
jgi:hypothetical protein